MINVQFLEKKVEKLQEAFLDNLAILNKVSSSPFIESNVTDEEKIEQIAFHFEKILEVIGLDLSDDSIRGTPRRYGKMLIKELFVGLKKENFPVITTQENKWNYNQMLIETRIEIKSICEHHFIPILGYCHIAYFPKEKIIGLSKLHRVAQYFARRPQVQERMTKQILESLVVALDTEDVAVVTDATHLCVKMRGVEDNCSSTRCADFSGLFLDPLIRKEFLSQIPLFENP
jgi:GTP cyclohydrolase IA